MSSYYNPQSPPSRRPVGDSSPYYGSRTSSNTGRQIISPSNKTDTNSPTKRVYQQQQQQDGFDYQPQSARGQETYDAKQQSDHDDAEHNAVMARLAENKCICDICTCKKHRCPSSVHLQARYDPSLASNYRDSYPRHEATIQRARAPPSNAFASGEKFEGASVTKSDYSGHPGARPAPLLKPAFRSTVGGDEERDFESENASNYKFHGYAKRGAAIPSHTMPVSNEPFVGQSTTKEDYQRWSAKPAEPVKPFTSAAPTGPDDRDFATTNGVSYNPKGFVARQIAVPFSSHLFDNSEDRSFETETRHHYTQKSIDHCPSDELMKHREKDQTKVVAGHLLYHHDKATGHYVPVDDFGRPKDGHN